MWDPTYVLACVHSVIYCIHMVGVHVWLLHTHHIHVHHHSALSTQSDHIHHMYLCWNYYVEYVSTVLHVSIPRDRPCHLGPTRIQLDFCHPDHTASWGGVLWYKHDSMILLIFHHGRYRCVIYNWAWICMHCLLSLPNCQFVIVLITYITRVHISPLFTVYQLEY